MGEEREHGEVATGDELLLRKEGGVLWVTLNRPAARNALTAVQRSQLVKLLEEASADFSVRAVVLTATGSSFCAGMDLRLGKVDTAGRSSEVPDRVAGDVAHLVRTGVQRLIAAVLDCEK